MESNRRTVFTPCVRAVLVIGVVACLCFSAGEGLRLTPLPSPAPAEAAPTDLQANAAHSRGPSLNRTGPLDMPLRGQVQKRGKRQAPECDCPPAGVARETTSQPLRHTGADRLLVRASRLSVSRPSGRAPPNAS